MSTIMIALIYSLIIMVFSFLLGHFTWHLGFGSSDHKIPYFSLPIHLISGFIILLFLSCSISMVNQEIGVQIIWSIFLILCALSLFSKNIRPWNKVFNREYFNQSWYLYIFIPIAIFFIFKFRLMQECPNADITSQVALASLIQIDQTYPIVYPFILEKPFEMIYSPFGPYFLVFLSNFFKINLNMAALIFWTSNFILMLHLMYLWGIHLFKNKIIWLLAPWTCFLHPYMYFKFDAAGPNKDIGVVIAGFALFLISLISEERKRTNQFLVWFATFALSTMVYVQPVTLIYFLAIFSVYSLLSIDSIAKIRQQFKLYPVVVFPILQVLWYKSSITIPDNMKAVFQENTHVIYNIFNALKYYYGHPIACLSIIGTFLLFVFYREPKHRIVWSMIMGTLFFSNAYRFYGFFHLPGYREWGGEFNKVFNSSTYYYELVLSYLNHHTIWRSISYLTIHIILLYLADWLIQVLTHAQKKAPLSFIAPFLSILITFVVPSLIPLILIGVIIEKLYKPSAKLTLIRTRQFSILIKFKNQIKNSSYLKLASYPFSIFLLSILILEFPLNALSFNYNTDQRLVIREIADWINKNTNENAFIINPPRSEKMLYETWWFPGYVKRKFLYTRVNMVSHNVHPAPLNYFSHDHIKHFYDTKGQENVSELKKEIGRLKATHLIFNGDTTQLEQIPFLRKRYQSTYKTYEFHETMTIYEIIDT